MNPAFYWLFFLCFALSLTASSSQDEQVCQDSSSETCSEIGTTNINTHNDNKETYPTILDDGFGIPQNIYPQYEEQIQQLSEEVHTYMQNQQSEDQSCQNHYADCYYWAVQGECEINMSFMLTECAVACQSCTELDYQSRCGEVFSDDIWGEGDLDAMFLNILQSFKQQIKVLRRPNQYLKGLWKLDKRLGYPLARLLDRWIGRKPWIIRFDNFLSPEECQELINLGHEMGYQRSQTVGERLPDGTYESVTDEDRTSSSTWCEDEYRDRPIVQHVLKKMETVTGIPSDHYEDLQLLHYSPGGLYNEHHDYIAIEPSRAQGPRILTVFIYLNDVEGGGHTNFTQVGLRVRPKRGSALIWPQTMNDDVLEMDQLTWHAAERVDQGEKYATNVWVHLRDYQWAKSGECLE